MKRIALILALLMLAALAPALALTPAAEGVNFTDGYFTFLKLDPTRRNSTDEFKLELSDFDNLPAVKIAPVGGKFPYIGVSISSLLSAEDLPKIAVIEFKLGVKSLDGKFWPLTGSIFQYAGEELEESETKFGVQTPDSNPKSVYSRVANPFTADAANYIILKPNQDDGSSYKGKNELYILGIIFRDADGESLPVDMRATPAFPDGFAVEKKKVITEEIILMEGPVEANWNNFGSSGSIPIDVWNRAVGLLVEYAPREDGSSPIDDNPGASKFVIQVIGGPAEQGWLEIQLDNPLVTSVKGKSLTLTLDDMDQVTDVYNIGLGCWDGNDTVTAIKLIVEKGPDVYELFSGPQQNGWINANSGGDVGIDVWNRATALVVEYAPRDDGTCPLDSLTNGNKFVIQVIGGPAEQGWNEIQLDDPLVSQVPGKSLTLALEDMDKVTEVQNVGFGCWNDANTITSIKLICSPKTERMVELGFTPYESNWNNFNSGGDIPIEVWQKATALLVMYAPNDDGSSPLDSSPGSSKFVIQVIGGPAEQGWKEIQLDDPLVLQTEGQSLRLTLDDMDKVTEVQNIGLGCWNGAETITQIYLIVE